MLWEWITIILRRYKFFQINNLFNSDFDWYKLPNLFHNFLVVSSPDTFNNSKSTRQSKIVLRYFLSRFSWSSFDVPVDMVLSLTSIHYSWSTKISSILSFHNSKLCPSNFSISILDMFDIMILDNILCRYQLLQIDKSHLQVQVQPFSNKGVPLQLNYGSDTTCSE